MTQANYWQEERPKLLVVDDEPTNLKVLKQILQDDYRLLFAKSGEEAIALAQREQPALILLDVMMPGMDGPSTLKALRALPSLAELPVAFMTAKVQPTEVAHYKTLGARDVIAKPFDPMTLASQVRAIWEA